MYFPILLYVSYIILNVHLYLNAVIQLILVSGVYSPSFLLVFIGEECV